MKSLTATGKSARPTDKDARNHHQHGRLMLRLREIVEAAAWVSAHSRMFIERPERRCELQLTEFWLLSRQRLHDWTQAIDTHLLAQVAGHGGARRGEGGELVPLVQEVLAAEVLARVWSATLTAADRHSAGDRYERLVRHVFTGHLHARHRALSLIAEGRQLPGRELPRLDQLRRRCERWTDVLVGHLVSRYDVEEFAFDAERAREFGGTQQDRGDVSPQHAVWGLILAGIGVSFPSGLVLPEPASERSRGVARAALMMSAPAAGQSAVTPVSADGHRPQVSSGDSGGIGFAPIRRRTAAG